jgi:hypothetical protein
MVLATLGLAMNVMLWSMPGLVAASALPHALFPDSAPTLASLLASAESGAGQSPGLADALVQLIGAEAEALQVAGAALRQPAPADLGPSANAAGARVLSAVNAYARSAQRTLGHVQHPD